MASRQSANGQAPPDWAVHYQPTGAPLLACSRHGCGANYLDDGPGRRAHVAVFGHSPRTEADTQSQEDPT